MNTTVLDTLDISKRLKRTKLSEQAAEEIAQIFQEVREADLSQLVTKTDLQTFELRLDKQLVRMENMLLKTMAGGALAIIGILFPLLKYFG